MAYDTPMEEVQARLRRIETRLSVLMEAQGVPSQIRRPEWGGNGEINIPSGGTSVQEILALMPATHTEVSVYCEGKRVCVVVKVWRQCTLYAPRR